MGPQRQSQASAPAVSFAQAWTRLLQRKCACGGSVGLTGACSTCESERLLGKPMQARLRVNEPGDEYEQEADRVAEQVMGMPGPNPRADEQRSYRTTPVERSVVEGGALLAEPGFVQSALASPGQPLDSKTRAFFESRFGHDFSRVRVHTDERAAGSARAVKALAYTLGQHVVFGAGQYAPGSGAGRQLLAHELTHVVQQDGVPGAMPAVAEGKRDAAAPSAGARIGQPVAVHPASTGFIQRQSESEPPTFPDFPGLLEALELNVGRNLQDYGHHLYQASILHPDDPDLLEDAFTRYALGLNVLKTSYSFAGFEQSTADKLALGTGILFKGLTFVREGEFTLDFQVDVGRGLKLETNVDLAVNPDDLTHVRKAGVNFGLLGHF